MGILTMDDLGTTPQNDYVYVVVQIGLPYLSNTFTEYSKARRVSMENEFASVILALTPETLESIQNGTTREIVI